MQKIGTEYRPTMIDGIDATVLTHVSESIFWENPACPIYIKIFRNRGWLGEDW